MVSGRDREYVDKSLSEIADAFEERDALKAALRELVDAVKEHKISIRSDLGYIADALQAGRFSDLKSYYGRESNKTQPRRDATLTTAESLLNKEADHAAERRATNAREMERAKQAMREVNKDDMSWCDDAEQEADHAETS